MIGRKGTINKPVYYDKPFWTVDTLFYSKIKKGYYPKFVYYLFNTIPWLKFNEATGVPSLTANNIKKLKVKCPSYNEQIMISDFLSDIDSKIDSLETKKEVLIHLKKYFQQKLFCNKHNIPELRFKEFNYVWEEYTLGEIADVTKLAGFEFTKYVEYEDQGQIIAIRAINIKNNQLDLSDVKYIDNSDFSKLKRSKLFNGDLLFTYVGVNIGDNCLIKENDKFYLAPNVCRIRTNENNNPYFIKQLFDTLTIDKEINKYINRTSQPTITMENMRNFKIITPLMEEQKKISDFLMYIDKKIELLEIEKKYNVDFKKVLLSKLFC